MLTLICIALQIYTLILFARIILSWVTMTGWRPPDALQPLIDGIYQLTEPVMRIFRGLIPPIGGLDLSAIFIFVIIALIRGALNC